MGGRYALISLVPQSADKDIAGVFEEISGVAGVAENGTMGYDARCTTSGFRTSTFEAERHSM